MSSPDWFTYHYWTLLRYCKLTTYATTETVGTRLLHYVWPSIVVYLDAIDIVDHEHIALLQVLWTALHSCWDYRPPQAVQRYNIKGPETHKLEWSICTQKKQIRSETRGLLSEYLCCRQSTVGQLSTRDASPSRMANIPEATFSSFPFVSKHPMLGISRV